MTLVRNRIPDADTGVVQTQQVPPHGVPQLPSRFLPPPPTPDHPSLPPTSHHSHLHSVIPSFQECSLHANTQYIYTLSGLAFFRTGAMQVFACIRDLGFLIAEHHSMCGWTAVCITSHPPEDIWVVCKFGCLQTKLLHGFLWKCKFSFP